MLGDKDILESIKNIKDRIDYWYVAQLTTQRAASLQQLQQAFKKDYISTVSFLSSIQKAYAEASQEAVTGDRIIIFGSFHTVSDVMIYKAAQTMSAGEQTSL
jgi:dihydrofolate synthase/folylpolyglutamate synthase